MIDTYCETARIVKLSRKDTLETIRQVRADNAVYRTRCPHKVK